MSAMNPDGLLLRRATAADTEALVAFTADVSRYQDTERPDESIAAWTRDLMTGRHPSFAPSDFTVVEDSATGAIVSSANLISQTWSYGGIELPVGQLELVGTHPDYRGRGLVRRQFAVLHEWSAQRGQHMLAIDGIPGFYRQFGYEMALALRDEVSVAVTRVPAGAAADDEAYHVRSAGERDLAFVAQLYREAAARYLVSCCRDETMWRYEVYGRGEHNPWRMRVCVIEGPRGQSVGLLVHAPRSAGHTLSVYQYEITATAAWAEVTPAVVRYLRSVGAADTPPPERVGFCLGAGHPVYAVLQALDGRAEGAYAWYVRVANLPAFLRHVAPVLERRLLNSAWARYTGELRITFYRDGIRLRFEYGQLTDVTSWHQPYGLSGIDKGVLGHPDRAMVSCPGLTFLQLVCGYRSFDELRYAFPDCLARTDAARDLLAVLFPKQPSNIWPIL